MKNDAAQTVVAVRFLITLHSGPVDEIADERRITVQLASQSTKTVAIGLAHIKGLRDRLKSEQQEQGLAILTVSAVEFSDGSEWKPSDTANSDMPASKPFVEQKK